MTASRHLAPVTESDLDRLSRKVRAEHAAVQRAAQSMLERFAERLRSGADPEAVIHELAGMLAAARVTRKKPEWLVTDRAPAAAYLLLGDDVALPLLYTRDGELIAMTLVMRGLMPAGYRAERNEGKAKGRSRRRLGRTTERAWTSQRRSGADAEEWA